MKKLIYNDLENILKEYNWYIKKDKSQLFGSSADIYAEYKNDYMFFYMIIEDGNVNLYNSITHIYSYDNNGKIFEGKFTTEFELRLLFKMLGFSKVNL